MILSQKNLKLIAKENLSVPAESTFNLPEKVLQFGTGVLLRGLPDYFINKANQQGIYNGRIAVVKSTSGGTANFESQDNLYTLCIRGLEDGQLVGQNIISSAISRVINAQQSWNDVLAIAGSPELQLVVSNTTEVGITLVNEEIGNQTPASFPAKLLSVLYHRFKIFNGSAESGLVIIATELIPDNGTKLAAIVMELAQFNNLGEKFITWLNEANVFCNSLVDRIVPGKPDALQLAHLEAELGYTDQLISVAEPYRLWAIEGDERVKHVLGFAAVDPGVIIAGDIEIYRELKVRLLNGTHSLSAGIACLLQIDTVKNALQNEKLKGYIESLMTLEIGPAIPYPVNEKQRTDFSKTVLERFANPFIEHLWQNIAFQYSMKMKIRILPVLDNYYKIYKHVPEHIALGFAAYLHYMKVDKYENGQYFGLLNGNSYLINDESAGYFHQQQIANRTGYAGMVLNDKDFWGMDLTMLPGFIPSVIEKYNLLTRSGMQVALDLLPVKKANLV